MTTHFQNEVCFSYVFIYSQLCMYTCGMPMSWCTRGSKKTICGQQSSSHCVNTRDRTQVVRLGDEHLYPLNHLVGLSPHPCFVFEDFWYKQVDLTTTCSLTRVLFPRQPVLKVLCMVGALDVAISFWMAQYFTKHYKTVLWLVIA